MVHAKTAVVRIAQFRRRPEATRYGWLSAGEWQRCHELADPRRREQWLAARWAAKRLLIAAYEGRSPRMSQIHIESRDGRNRPVAPRVFLDGRLLDLSLSLSHDSHEAMACVGTAGNRVGCDLGRLGEFTSGFVRLWFGDAERVWLDRAAQVRSRCGSTSQIATQPGTLHLPGLLWALKEACYKTLGGGDCFVPRQWDVVDIFAAHDIPLPPAGDLRSSRRLANAGREIHIEVSTGSRCRVAMSLPRNRVGGPNACPPDSTLNAA